MARYFLTLAYDGTDFIGWQRQPKGRSVQATVEDALSKLAQVPCPVVGSGRTDAGVHAQGQVAHVDLPYDLPADWLYRLNALLPPDLACLQATPVADELHARFSAQSRTYRYFCTLQKSPFNNRFCARLPYRTLDLQAMNAAAACLLGEHSFRSFAKAVPEETHYLCHVSQAIWEALPVQAGPVGGATLAFTITANRFLRGQVRAIVGALLEVGKGKRPPHWVAEVLALQSQQVQAMLAPAEGLHLWEVQYPLP